jgi:hypothetical protein
VKACATPELGLDSRDAAHDRRIGRVVVQLTLGQAAQLAADHLGHARAGKAVAELPACLRRVEQDDVRQQRADLGRVDVGLVGHRRLPRFASQ